MKAGILLPRSGAYPAINKQLLSSLKLYLKEKGTEDKIGFVSENIGFGGVDKEVYQTAKLLLTEEEPDVLIAYTDMKVMPLLEPLINAEDKLMIVIHTGANSAEKKVPQPGIVYLTLQQAFLCSLTGKLTKSAPGVYVSTFYDCGYMHGAALTDALANNNGTLLFNYINKLLYDGSFHINELIEFLNNHPDNEMQVLCALDAAPAALFYKKLNEYKYADKLQLFVSPMMLTKEALKEIGDGFRFSLQGYTSWNPDAESIFSISGTHAGMLLNEVLAMPEEIKSSPERTVKELQQVSLSTADGTWKLDPLTNFFITDTVYKCSLPAGETKLIVTPEKTNKKDWDNFIEQQKDNHSAGWTNTYLCY